MLECAGEFRLCGGDHGLCPLDSHKPLKRLDRNFKCFGAVTFVWLIGLYAKLTPRLLSLGSHFLGRVQIKKSKQKQAAAVNASACGFLFGIYFKYLADKLFMDRVFAIPFFSVGFVQLFKVKVACV